VLDFSVTDEPSGTLTIVRGDHVIVVRRDQTEQKLREDLGDAGFTSAGTVSSDMDSRTLWRPLRDELRYAVLVTRRGTSYVVWNSTYCEIVCRDGFVATFVYSTDLAQLIRSRELEDRPVDGQQTGNGHT
jgi:hypothetical protein